MGDVVAYDLDSDLVTTIATNIDISGGFAVSPITDNVFVSSYANSTIKEYENQAGIWNLVSTMDSTYSLSGPQGMCFSDDGLLYVANEGTLVVVVASDVSEYLVENMRRQPEAAGAIIVGKVEKEPAGAVVLSTSIGGSRLVDMLQGDQLPRIC